MQFDTMKKGYNRYQVDSAVKNLEDEVIALKKTVEAYNLQSSEDKQKLVTLNNRLEALNENISVKEKAASQMAQIAMREASEMIQTANENADAIVKEAYYSAREILRNISELGIEAKGIKDNLNIQLKQLSDTIDSFDVPPIPNASILNKCND